ncbi:hypothetical protein [Allorhizocola rhizosphaerae]|uniref:hypothetical protein n=1 Tax=Allorhizocola rhizosphaerae TaxID=1872709 RepID=UPI000E3EB466|nr:hypothetical protein [Allorhizocola rhizosphaerae]
MNALRTAFLAVTTILALVATPAAPAHASATFPFAAPSGDNCRYAAAKGSLTWGYSTTAPIRPTSVDIRGRLVDHPLPDEWGFLCRDDRFYAVTTFTAYAGSSILRAEVLADNEVADITITIRPTATAAGISRLTVQVCRHPLPVTRPPAPGYCGPPQHYAPVVYDPPSN